MATRTTASGSSPLTWKIGACDSARDVGGVHTRAGRGRCGGEADLVVDDDVDRATGAVAAQLRQLERLGHDTLAREGSVTVQQQRAAR